MFTPTVSSPIKSPRVPVGFSYSLNSAQVKNSKGMENFNTLVSHTIMWRNRWRRKRRNTWVHPINIKRPDFGIFSHFYPDLLKDEEKVHFFFLIYNEHRAILPSVTVGGRGNTKSKHQL